MELEEQQLVIKWRSLGELKDKLRAMLGELEGTLEVRPSRSEPIPDEIRRLGLNTFSAAMLAVLRDSHQGRSNAIDAPGLAREMKERFPLLFAKRKLGEIAHGTIFPGQKMAESRLIHMERSADPKFPNQTRRLYWCG